MTENICRYAGDRDQAIVSYLYNDDGGFDPAERAAFDAHLATCNRCRTELAAFDSVRLSLGRWSPPSFSLETDSSWGPPSGGPLRLPSLTLRPGKPDPTASASRSWWRDIPAWAQVAAAMLCLGVGAAIANLDVRYDSNGLQVRTGWLAVSPVARNSQPAAGSPGNDIASRAELIALEQRLRADLRQPPATVASALGAGNAANSINNDTVRRVRALVDESERRQQTELALRLAEAMREVNAQRQADLVRIDHNIGAMQNNTGREMLRQRNEMLNYVSLRTASQRPQ
jgi:anti-sigma factor RsiW